MLSKRKNVEEIPAVEGQKSTKRFVKVVVRKGLRSKVDRRRGRYRVKTKAQKELERKLKEKKAKRDAKKALKNSSEYKILLKQVQELQKKLLENETKEKKISSSGRYSGPTRGVGAAFGPQQSGASKQDIANLLKEQQEKLQKELEEFKNSFTSEFLKQKKKEEEEDNFESNFVFGNTFSNDPKKTRRTQRTPQPSNLRSSDPPIRPLSSQLNVKGSLIDSELNDIDFLSEDIIRPTSRQGNVEGSIINSELDDIDTLRGTSREKSNETKKINIRYAPFSDESESSERIQELDETPTTTRTIIDSELDDIDELQREIEETPPPPPSTQPPPQSRGLRTITYRPNLQIPQQLEPPIPPQIIQEPEPQPQPIPTPNRQSHQQAQEQNTSSSRFSGAITPQQIAERNRLDIPNLKKENEEIKIKIKQLVDDYNTSLQLAIANNPPTPDSLRNIPDEIKPSITPTKIQFILSRFENDSEYGIIVEKLRQIRTLARQLQSNRTSISEKRKTL